MPDAHREVQIVTDHGVSRRSLFRAAGVGAAVVGGGALLEACSSGIQGAASSSTPSTASSGSGSSAATTSKQITIGWIHPLTGSLAGFGYPDNWVLQQVMATSKFKNGIKIGGSTYSVNIKSYDTQSSVTRAGSLAKQAIQQDNVDLLLASSTPGDGQRGRVRGGDPRHPAGLLQHPVGVLVHQPGRQPAEADAQAQVDHHVLPRRRAPRARLRADVGQDRREVRQQPQGRRRVPERL